MRLCSCCESAASPKLKSFGSGILEHLVVGLGDHAAQRLAEVAIFCHGDSATAVTPPWQAAFDWACLGYFLEINFPEKALHRAVVELI